MQESVEAAGLEPAVTPFSVAVIPDSDTPPSVLPPTLAGGRFCVS